jgi:calcium/proton exchanger cax
VFVRDNNKSQQESTRVNKSASGVMSPAYNTFRQDVVFHHGSTSFESLVAKFILNSRTNWLLLSIAPAALCYHASLSEGATALFSLLALIPLSERLSFSAGLLSLYFSSKWALPLQICLNNLTELFICAVALYFGLKRFVVLYLIGSSWFCTLFIIGTTLLYAGWYFDTIRFHTNLSHTYSMLLVFLAACIATPEVIYDGGESSFLQIEGFTRAIAIILLLVYISYIVFQVHCGRLRGSGGVL